MKPIVGESYTIQEYLNMLPDFRQAVLRFQRQILTGCKTGDKISMYLVKDLSIGELQRFEESVKAGKIF
jgi:hypothetical protein